jgi:hypothetical protein
LNKDSQTPIDLCATKQVRSYIERAIEQSGWTGWVDQNLAIHNCIIHVGAK